MKKDKKSEGANIRFVLLKDLGKTVSDQKVTENDLLNPYRIAFGQGSER